MYMDEKTDELRETLLQVERQLKRAKEELSRVRREKHLLLAQAHIKMKEQISTTPMTLADPVAESGSG